MREGFISISRLEAAERQMAQAIRLFFYRGDPVSVHTLAAAAYQVLSDICKSRGIPREIEDSDILEEMGVKREVIDAMRKPQNFFKHGTGRADEAVRFNPMLSVCFLIYGVQFLYAIAQRQFPEGIVFRSWFYCRHPERLPLQLQDQFRRWAAIVDPSDLAFFSEQITRLQSRANG